MKPELLFTIANAWILPAWILLAFLPRWKGTPYIVILAGVLPLAICYTILLVTSFGDMDPDTFSTLEGLGSAFTNPMALLTGWVHYLAFDLFVGFVITYDSLKNRIHIGFRIVALFFTLMSGPMGWLIYFIIRTIKLRKVHFDLTVVSRMRAGPSLPNRTDVARSRLIRAYLWHNTHDDDEARCSLVVIPCPLRRHIGGLWHLELSTKQYSL